MKHAVHWWNRKCPTKQLGHEASPGSNWYPVRIWSHAIKSVKLKPLCWVSRTGSLYPALNMVHFCCSAYCSVLYLYISFPSAHPRYCEHLPWFSLTGIIELICALSPLVQVSAGYPVMWQGSRVQLPDSGVQRVTAGKHLKFSAKAFLNLLSKVSPGLHWCKATSDEIRTRCDSISFKKCPIWIIICFSNISRWIWVICITEYSAGLRREMRIFLQCLVIKLWLSQLPGRLHYFIEHQSIIKWMAKKG